MPKTNGGIAAFQANIDRMREVGRQHREQRSRQAQDNTVHHIDRMNARGVAAGVVRATRAAEGVSKRDEHNARLRAEREEREARVQAMKLATAGDRNMRALAALA